MNGQLITWAELAMKREYITFVLRLNFNEYYLLYSGSISILPSEMLGFYRAYCNTNLKRYISQNEGLWKMDYVENSKLSINNMGTYEKGMLPFVARFNFNTSK